MVAHARAGRRIQALRQVLMVSCVIGLDALEAARPVCLRDRPGIYSAYVVGDLAAPSSALRVRLRGHRPCGLISAGAIDGTHAPPVALVAALGCPRSALRWCSRSTRAG